MKIPNKKRFIKIVSLMLLLISFVVYKNLPRTSPGSEVIMSHIVDPTQGNLHLYWKDEKENRLGNYEELIKYLDRQNQELVFGMNAGIFGADFKPLGLHVEKGHVLSGLNTEDSSAGNFYLKPNGVFYLTKEHKPFILKTEDFVLTDDIEYAVQSGPMLLMDGVFHPALQEGSSNLHYRNGVGILPDGKLIFAMSTKKINFYNFARFFKEQGCQNALYLDGFISETYLPEKGFTKFGGPFVGMWGEVKNKMIEE